VSDEPPCPSCGGPVAPDWDWCHHCGFDPDRPDHPRKPTGTEPRDHDQDRTPSSDSSAVADSLFDRSPPKPPRVYEPDDEPGRWRFVIIALVIVAVSVVGLLVAQVLLGRGETTSRPTGAPSLDQIAGQGELRELEDGWFEFSPSAADFVLETPVDLLRTTDDAAHPHGATTPAPFYVHADDTSLVLVVLVRFTGDLPRQQMVLPDLVAGSTLSTPVRAERSAIEAVEAHGTMDGRSLSALQFVHDGHFVVVAVADVDPEVVRLRFDRMVSSLDDR
jgi:hypothetical protein